MQLTIWESVYKESELYKTEDMGYAVYTILLKQLKEDDIVPIYNFKVKKLIDCKIIKIELKDNPENAWKFSGIPISQIKYAIYFTPVKRSKILYKTYVFKDNKISLDWRQQTTSDTYYSKSLRDYNKIYNAGR